MKYAIFWVVTPCDPGKNRRFGGTYHLHHQGDKNQRARNDSSNQQLKHAADDGGDNVLRKVGSY
jgi:hypothetical protein